jgi:hypothetical protein
VFLEPDATFCSCTKVAKKALLENAFTKRFTSQDCRNIHSSIACSDLPTYPLALQRDINSGVAAYQSLQTMTPSVFRLAEINQIDTIPCSWFPCF